MSDDELLQFLDATEEVSENIAHETVPWTILIVDDNDGVHAITKLALEDITFDGRPVRFLSAHSGNEARTILRERTPIAVMLLDVVMETEDAGLQLVEYTRRELQNVETRIVLRTGQPGQAPARKVIVDYDIDAYEPKTELTSERLFTTVISALRAYRDIKKLESGQRGLNVIVDSGAAIFRLQSLEEFTGEVLGRLAELLSHIEALSLEGAFVTREKILDGERVERRLLAGSGVYANDIGKSLAVIWSASDDERLGILETGCQKLKNWQGCGAFACTVEGETFHLWIEFRGEIDELGHSLLNAFWSNVTIAFENLVAHARILELKESYSRFAPSDAMTFLGVGDITEIELGDNRRRNMSVLFLDIRSFVELSEEMSPTDCFRFINSFLHHIGGSVNGNHGVVNKYLGDGLMAIFSREGQHASDAVQCALDLLDSTNRYNHEYRKEGQEALKDGFKPRQPVEIGIGIHSGPVVLGTVGYASRLEFTLLGETVNLASRIEALTKRCGSRLLIHDDVVPQLTTVVDKRPLPILRIRGKREGIRVWDVFQGDASEQRSIKEAQMDRFKEAVKLADEKSFEDAWELFATLFAENPKDRVVENQLKSLNRLSADQGHSSREKPST